MEEIKKTGLEVKADTSDAGKTTDINQTDKTAIDYSADHDKANDSNANDTADTKGNYPDKTVTDNTNDTLDSNTAYTDTEDKPERKHHNIDDYNKRLTQEQRKEAARRAGIASGQARRERKTLGEELKAILSSGDNQERMCMALFKSALSGDYRAFNSLRDTIGEMPTQKQEVNASITAGDQALLDKVSKRLGIEKCSPDTDETTTDNE